MSLSGGGALSGLLCAIGVLILVSGFARSRKPALLEQISPYIPTSNALRSLQRKQPSPFDIVVALLAPLMIERASTHKIEERLARAGKCHSWITPEFLCSCVWLVSTCVLNTHHSRSSDGRSHLGQKAQ